MNAGTLLREYLTIAPLLPSAFRGDGDEGSRRARLAIYFAIALLVQCGVYMATYATGGHGAPVAWIGAGAVGLCFVPLTLRSRHPHLWSSCVVAGVSLVVLTAVAYFTGGLYSTSIWWTCLVPVLAMLVSGKRMALVMAALQLVVVSAFYVATDSGFHFPSDLDPRDHPDLTLIDVAMLSATLVVLAWLFERAKERTLRALAASRDELQLVLDNVGQGFLCCSRAGAMQGSRSAIVEDWFGVADPGVPVWNYIGAANSEVRDWLELGWNGLAEDILPIELCLEQLPRSFTMGEQSFEIEYKPVMHGADLVHVVVVVTDVSARVQSDRAEAEQRQFAAALDHALRDPSGFRQFLDEISELLAQLDESSPELARILHTVKGNCAFFGVPRIAQDVHALEDALRDGDPIGAQLEKLQAQWVAFSKRIAGVLERSANGIEISPEDFAELRSAIQSGTTHATLDRQVAELRYERAIVPLTRAAEQARALSRRLGKGDIDVSVKDEGLRLDPRRWRSLWSAMIHAVRNAVDHGLEPPETRTAAGKPRAGRISLSAAMVDREIVIRISDDGRGISWERVAERAREKGLPHSTHADWLEALFGDGLSTSEQVTEVSGRGIGMGAFRSAVGELGGRIECSSQPNQGTTLECRFPASAANSLAPVPPRTVASARPHAPEPL